MQTIIYLTLIIIFTIFLAIKIIVILPKNSTDLQPIQMPINLSFALYRWILSNTNVNSFFTKPMHSHEYYSNILKLKNIN